jgi:hypothetical protein
MQSAESEHVQTTPPQGLRADVGQLAASYAARMSADTRPRSGTS